MEDYLVLINQKPISCDFRPPPRRRWDLYFSGLLRSVQW